ncbi:MAG: DMT family transporter [Chloroflexota bacterium]
MQRSTDLVGFGLVILAGSMFGTLGIVSRLAYDLGLAPASLVAWRGLFGFIGIGAIVAIGLTRGRRLVRRRDVGRSVRLPLATAMVAAWGLNMAMFLAFERVTVALALLGFYLYPALVTIVDVWNGHEHVDRPKLIALVLSLGGMVLVVGGGLGSAASLRIDTLGLGLALLAAVIQTVFVVVSRDGYSAIPADQAMTSILGAVAILAVGAALVMGPVEGLLLPLRDPQLLALTVFAGVFGAAIPSLLFLIGIRRLGGTRAGILMLTEPAMGVTLAAIVLAEALLPIQALGAVAILVGAVVLQRAAPGGSREAPVGSAGGSEAALAIDTAEDR